jgi:hypothetical protein
MHENRTPLERRRTNCRRRDSFSFRAAFLGVFLKFDLEPSLLTAGSVRHQTSGSPLENRPSAGAQ